MDGGEKRGYQPKMKRPVQLLSGKRPIMANPLVNEVDSDAVSNQPGLSSSTDSHFSKISIWSETANKGRRQRGCMKWILLSLLKSDGWPAITQPSWHKSQAVTSCFNEETTKKSTAPSQREGSEWSIFTYIYLLGQLISTGMLVNIWNIKNYWQHHCIGSCKKFKATFCFLKNIHFFTYFLFLFHFFSLQIHILNQCSHLYFPFPWWKSHMFSYVQPI